MRSYSFVGNKCKNDLITMTEDLVHLHPMKAFNSQAR